MKRIVIIAVAVVSVLAVCVAVRLIRYQADQITVCSIIYEGTSKDLTEFVFLNVAYFKKIEKWTTTQEQSDAKIKSLELYKDDPKLIERAHNEIKNFDELSRNRNAVMYWPTSRGFPAKYPYIIIYNNNNVDKIYNVFSSITATEQKCK